ncbi:MAG: MaoC/PaaZ C-terminal domain-containing protein [Dehalococcoidia bacterium]
MYFEEFEVGQRFEVGARTVTAEDLSAMALLSGDNHPLHTDPEYAKNTIFGAPILHASFGGAVAAGMWAQLGLVRDSVIAATSDRWEYHRPIYVGDTLRLRLTITRLRPSSRPDRGCVMRYNELLNQKAELVQSGTSCALVTAQDATSRFPSRDVGTVAWAEMLGDALSDNDAFIAAASAWDGTIGINAGEHTVSIRLYRGRAIEVARRTPREPTFILHGSDIDWVEYLTDPDANFGRYIMKKRFNVSGNRYEYLRLTKALELLMETARRMSLGTGE